MHISITTYKCHNEIIKVIDHLLPDEKQIFLPCHFISIGRVISSFFWPNINLLLYGKNQEYYLCVLLLQKIFSMKSHRSFSLFPSFLVTDRLRNINMVMKTSRLWKKKKTSHALRFKRSKKLILLLSTDLLHDF